MQKRVYICGDSVPWHHVVRYLIGRDVRCMNYGGQQGCSSFLREALLLWAERFCSCTWNSRCGMRKNAGWQQCKKVVPHVQVWGYRLSRHPDRGVHQPSVMKPCVKLLKTTTVPALGACPPSSHGTIDLHESWIQQQTVTIHPPRPDTPASADTCWCLTPTADKKPTRQKASLMYVTGDEKWVCMKYANRRTHCFSQARWQIVQTGGLSKKVMFCIWCKEGPLH